MVVVVKQTYNQLNRLHRPIWKQVGWFLRPDCTPRSECPPNVVPNSKFRTCPDPKFRNVLHSKFMNIPNVKFLNVPLCSTPMSYLAANGVVRCATGTTQCVGACSEQYTRWLRRARSIGRGCRVHTCVMAIGADFRLYLLRQFCSN